MGKCKQWAWAWTMFQATFVSAHSQSTGYKRVEVWQRSPGRCALAGWQTLKPARHSSQHVQPKEPALAAPASKKKRKKSAAEPARTGEPAKESAEVEVCYMNRNICIWAGDVRAKDRFIVGGGVQSVLRCVAYQG